MKKSALGTKHGYKADPLAKPASGSSPAAAAGVNKVGKTSGKFGTSKEGKASGKK